MFNKTAKKQGGFTLIELVTVIVILGTLAVTAAPKFLNLQNDARKATLAGMKGAVETSVTQVYTSSVLAAQEQEATASLTIYGAQITAIYGYPEAKFSSTWSKLLNAEFGEAGLTESNEHEWIWRNPGKGTIYFMPRGFSQTSTNCWIGYSQPTSQATSTYQIVMEDSGC